jgi:hypothetical protein
MPGHITVIALMHAEEPEKVCVGVIAGNRTFTLPKQCSQIVSTAQDGSLSNVKVLCGRVEVE